MPRPTAEKMQTYIATARHKQQQRQQFLSYRRQQALAIAQKAAKILRQEFKVRHVVLLGSVLSEAAFHELSDIDLAVWGLPSADFFKAVSRLLELSDFSIDLIEAESANLYLQEAIAQGQEL